MRVRAYIVLATKEAFLEEARGSVKLEGKREDQ